MRLGGLVVGLFALVGAPAAADTCTLSDHSASRGWTLTRNAVISADYTSIVAGYATLIASSNHQYDLWDIASGARIRALGEADELSEDRTRGVFVARGQPPELIDLRTGATLARLDTLGTPDRILCCVSFTGDSQWLILSREGGGPVEIRSARTGVLSGAFQIPADMYDELISPDGSRLFAVVGDQVSLIEISSGRVLTSFPVRVGGAYAVFSPDSSRVVIENDREYRLLDARSGATLAAGRSDAWGRFHTGASPFLDAARYVLFFGADGEALISDTQTGRPHISLGLLAQTPRSAYIIDFDVHSSPDGRTFVTRYRDGTAALWDVRTGRRLATLGRFVLADSYDRHDDEEEAIIIGGRPSPPLDLQFTPDGSRLIAVDREQTLALWNARTGELIRRLSEGIFRDDAWISPLGDWLHVERDDHMLIWSTRTGSQGAASELSGWDAYVEFSQNERFAVIGDRETRELWDLRRRRRLADLGGVTDRSRNESFSSDERHLMFARADDAHTVLWDTRVNAQVADLGRLQTHSAFDWNGLSMASLMEVEHPRYGLWDLRARREIVTCTTNVTVAISLGDHDAALIVRVGDGDEIWRLTPPRRS